MKSFRRTWIFGLALVEFDFQRWMYSQENPNRDLALSQDTVVRPQEVFVRYRACMMSTQGK